MEHFKREKAEKKAKKKEKAFGAGLGFSVCSGVSGFGLRTYILDSDGWAPLQGKEHLVLG